MIFASLRFLFMPGSCIDCNQENYHALTFFSRLEQRQNPIFVIAVRVTANQ